MIAETEKNVLRDYFNKSEVQVVEEIDFEKKLISYADTINQYREIKTISGTEEFVRAFLLTRLVNELGYKPENIEIEKEYDVGRPKVNKPRIDIIVRDKNGNVFLYIELKSPEDFERDKDEIIENNSDYYCPYCYDNYIKEKQKEEEI